MPARVRSPRSVDAHFAFAYACGCRETRAESHAFGGMMSNRSADKPDATDPPPLPKSSDSAATPLSARQRTLMYGREEADDFTAAPPNQGAPAPDLFIEAPTTRRKPAGKQVAAAEVGASEDPDDQATRLTAMEDLETKELDDDEGSAYIGKLIDDRYMVKSLIGRGGMGAVYRVEQIHLRKEMAIKLLHENLVARKQLISRFTREARAISRLSSQHTVMVYDFGRYGELFYLVMELLEGEPLDGILTKVGPMDAERTTRILLQMCDSLKEAHDHGIVHRDLKPENVMVLHEGPHPDFIKILDFGLAKVEDVDDPYTIHSQKDIFGTPFYMSPEQIRAADVDGRSDIYSVGALAFRMLTGKQVFGDHKTTFDVLKAHLMQPAPRMREVAPEGIEIADALEDIVAKCLAKHPEDRFGDMGELHTALVGARRSNFADAGFSEEERRLIEQRRQAGGPGADVILPRTMVSRETRARLADEELLGRPVRRGKVAQALQFIFVIMLMFAGIGGAMWALGSGGIGQEKEPNDIPDQANQLDEHNVAKGAIGERRGNTKADRDCFRLPPMQATDNLTLRVKGVPTMDLLVTVHDPAGVELARTSHRGLGDGELLANLDTSRNPATVCVTEDTEVGKVAGESLSDIYTLTATIAPRDGVYEREPNDQGRTDELPAGRALTAALDGPKDRDVYSMQGAFDGRIVRVKLQSADDRDLAGVHVILLDTSGRTLGARIVKEGQRKTELAFAASTRQLPDRVVVRPGASVAAMWRQLKRDTFGYKLWYDLEDLGDQGEGEPNNTAPSASDMVLGAWHIGNAEDAAGVDWLRIDAGDPAMKRIHLQANAPAGSGFWLTVRDAGSQADLRKLKVNSSKDADLYIDGSGAGFLVRVDRLGGNTAVRGGKQGSKYRIRARWALTGPPVQIP